MPAGYSGTPLAQKQGFKSGMRVAFVNPPTHYARLLGTLPDDIIVRSRVVGVFDLIHWFVDRQVLLDRKLSSLAAALKPDGMLWISWPKKTSSLPSDISGNDVRDTVLRGQRDLVDIKVCAVDDDWSGLKFVIRKSAR